MTTVPALFLLAAMAAAGSALAHGGAASPPVPPDQAVRPATPRDTSACGRGAMLFTGYFDNTDVLFQLGQIAIGGAR